MVARHQDLCEFPIPEGWEFYPDESGGGLISPGREAVLHVHCEAVQDPTELPNLSRMLAGFLTGHYKPVATDDLLRFKSEGALGFAYQYADGDRAVRVWIIGNPDAWAFLNFQGPLENEAGFREPVDKVVREFRLL